MQELFVSRFSLLAANDKLASLNGYVQFVRTETCDGKRDAQLLFFGLLDIVGRIAVCGVLGGSFEQAFQMLETQKKRAIEVNGPVHFKALLQAALVKLTPLSGRPVCCRRPRYWASPSGNNVGCARTKSRVWFPGLSTNGCDVNPPVVLLDDA